MSLGGINTNTINNEVKVSHSEELSTPQKIGRKTATYAASYLAGSFSMSLIKNLLGVTINKELKACEFGLQEESSIFADAANKAFKESILPEKGVSFMSIEDLKKEISGLEQSLEKADSKSARKILNKRIHKLKSYLLGENACFTTKANKILVNTEKFASATFHEMGHALNYNTKGIGNILYNLRPKSGKYNILWVIALLCAFRKKKNDGETSETFIGKSLDFAKDHCGEVAAAACAPAVLEEGLASIKGIKMSKPYLSVAELSKLKHRYFGAGLTYAVTAAAGVMAVSVIDLVRNKMGEKLNV